MTKNKFLDDLINRLEEISKIDRGAMSVVLINSDEAKELLESDYVKRDEITADDIPESLRVEIAGKGYDKGYEAGFESFKYSEEYEELIDKAIAEFQKYMDFDDVPEDLYALIYEDGERAGYEQGSFIGEKVKVPAVVAEFVEKEKLRKDTLYQTLGRVDNLTTYTEEWIKLADNVNPYNMVAEAYLHGYEVEEEKLYRIYEPTTERYLTFAGGQYAWFLSKQDDAKQQFTEQEIKNLDERLWAFAVEVTE